MTEFRKLVTATALSVLVHVTLFTALALMPEPVPSATAPEEENAPLEVTIHAEEKVEIEPFPLNPVLPEPVPAEAIRTQIDPENLKKAEHAPEHPADIAAHDSQASSGKKPAETTPEPTPEPADTAALAVQKEPPKAGESGDPGVDALGHYGKAVGNAIGVRSEYYQHEHKHELAVGEVRLKFAIDARGEVSDIRVLSNSAQPANATYAVRAVREAKIPPIPAERLAQLPGGRIEIVYTFTIYPTQ